ncbi:hypothetical protein FOPG_07084 [Fusarium oxysporum f. sp. conglutinans race 2 54008]|uniref:Uncharacterized protein n=2 Tax=Fusarium oxysporum TaxID=5507 RepID=X0NAJ9_FUSOX|nr:hypothetical protein FOPG_07084 [Fusarium oxysporum f. sp. conglutinans race 2 54008]EXM29680.1 hypothetical protein FOTG_04823 [Fusarium oxysporum f. sp. vasinfectum 25433]KAH7222112.1 hypothetical protein BKA60DRAFT_633979 [Fusarium oxysporum]KAK2675622.1 hypothetical protein RAB80_007807 [Fusarium oxysporum f. sp. vasinfectum]KAI8409518.1 hypothetical protein FOFC_09358 [Fusarium oxysporum]
MTIHVNTDGMDLGQPSGYGPPKIAVLWYNLVSSELAYDYGESGEWPSLSSPGAFLPTRIWLRQDCDADDEGAQSEHFPITKKHPLMGLNDTGYDPPQQHRDLLKPNSDSSQTRNWTIHLFTASCIQQCFMQSLNSEDS